MMKKGLGMEKDGYTSSAFTSSSVSTFSSCYDGSEHNMWNPLFELFCHMQIGLCMETQADEVSTARVALSCKMALLHCIGKKKVTLRPSSVLSDRAGKQCRPKALQTSTASTLASLNHYLRLLHEFHFF